MQIDAYKSLRDEKHLLTLLRQLRYLEKALPDWEPPVLEHVLLQEVHPFAASQ